jgi:hypothetical protein
VKILGLSIVVGLGIVIGWWWTRDDVAPTPATQPSQHSRRTAATQPSPRSLTSRSSVTSTRPTLAQQPLPTLEPAEVDPARRERQEELWRALRAFATDAELTDAQWEQFQRDLSELAALESATMRDAIATGNFDGIVDLSNELELELELRCAAYLTKRQVSALRFRFDGLVTRVRRLYYVPQFAPRT